MRRYLLWVGIPLVLVLDVVTIFVDFFGPALRVATITVLTGILIVFAIVRLIDFRRMARERDAAFAALRRQRAKPKPE
ncbi:MAG TPA: hypothetical protein VHG91_15555 [Longimicrobium sp.]|nr:hypothetical protein [Longimicrobium sp.]